MSSSIKLAVIGATGAVGQEMFKIIEERNISIDKLIATAAPEEAGSVLKFRGEDIIVRESSEAVFREADIALFAIDSDISKNLAPVARSHNCVVVDNSSAFRLAEDVPLVVPEVNPQDIKLHQGLIANPNCSTIIMVVAINPLHLAFEITRVVVSTYQAVSGAGKAGLDELLDATRDYLAGKQAAAKVFQYPIAFNLIPHIDVFADDGYTKEELKMVYETRKIMHAPNLQVCPTTVRVPVLRSHSESINIETVKPFDLDAVRRVLEAAPGVVLQDNPAEKLYPMPLTASGTDEVYVGRIRRDNTIANGLVIWAVGDQIRKGAATNAVQIVEELVRQNLY